MYLLSALVSLLITSYSSDVFECTEEDSNVEHPVMRLPRINLLKYTNGSYQDREEVVSSFKQYLHEYHSVSLYNHGIPLNIYHDLQKAGYAFHRKSEEYKSTFASNGLGTPGFDRFQSVSAANSYSESAASEAVDTKGDYLEMFALFNHIAGNYNEDYGTYYPLETNRPVELHHFYQAMIGQYQRVLEIVHRITSEALLGMNNSDYFENMYSNTPHLQLRSLYYPILNETILNRKKYRISEHNDYLGFTLYIPGNTRGLQNKIGNIWMDCQTDGEVGNDVFVNVGELFKFWTNGYWMPNWHRVVYDDNERITFSFFTGPDQETMVKPIEGCDVCTMESAKYSERTAAVHAKMRFSRGDLVNPHGNKFYS